MLRLAVEVVVSLKRKIDLVIVSQADAVMDINVVEMHCM